VRLSIYRADVGRGVLRDYERTLLDRAVDVTMFSRDALVLGFILEYIDQDGEWQAYELDEDAVLTFGIKKGSTRQGDFLVLSENEQWDRDGDWAAVGVTDGAHSVYVDLNTVALLAEFATDTESLDLVMEIQEQVAGGDPTTLLQAKCRVIQDIIQGDEGDPEEADPAYVTEAYVESRLTQDITPTNGMVRIADGELQVWNAEQSKWHTISIAGAAGQEQIVIHQGESAS
jgi:hypothetical protein